MLFEKLSAEDKEKIDYYRKTYAWLESAERITDDYAPLENILAYWDKAKSEYLYKLFGEKLQITFPIQYEKPFDELCDEMFECAYGTSIFGRQKHEGRTFIKAFKKFVQTRPVDEDNLHMLVTEETLVNNTYEGESFAVTLPNGKTWDILPGAKAIRVLGRLAREFDIEGFEDFRLCHSLVLNGRKMTGNLTLSIHPLDYMTMSDNDCGWDSCMKWIEQGDYRRGTVEMMNSESVIVAYLESSTPFHMGGEYTWNNKKWRSLFAIDKNVVLSVKGYPYEFNEGNEIVVNILKDLAKKNLGWEYGENQKYNRNKSNYSVNMPFLDSKLTFSLDTGAMYDDINSVDYHTVAISNTLSAAECSYWRFGDQYTYTIPYSGIANCMICGSADNDFPDDNTSSLACNHCEGFSVNYCEACDCTIWDEDDIYILDGRCYCRDCYDKLVKYCVWCEDEHDRDNMIELYVVPRLDEQQQKELREYYEFTYPEDSQIWKPYFERLGLDIEMTYNPIDEDFCFYLCNDCYTEWLEKNLKPNTKIHSRYIKGRKIVAVYFDELKEEACDSFKYDDFKRFDLSRVCYTARTETF